MGQGVNYARVGYRLDISNPWLTLRTLLGVAGAVERWRWARIVLTMGTRADEAVSGCGG